MKKIETVLIRLLWRSRNRVKVAFYDTKAYDRPSFEHYGSIHDMQFRFLETKLNDDLLARLITMPNVIVTSHQAFLTEEAQNNIAETTVNNILSYFNNDGICDNELCYRCGNIEQCRKERRQRCF